jgi:hypothetical protein
MRLRAAAPRRCVRARCGAAAAVAAAAAALLALALLAVAVAVTHAQHDTLGGARQGNGNGAKKAGAAPELYTYKVVKSYPHDAKCFTQGLVVRACVRCVCVCAFPPSQGFLSLFAL